MSARAGIVLGTLVVGVAQTPATVGAQTPTSPPTNGPRPAASAPPTFIRGVRVFDGVRVRPRADVLLAGGRIAAVGARLTAPAGARVVDGAGRTLLPGLIDAHVHAFGGALAAALPFGVTAALDQFTDQRFAAAMRAEQRAPGGAPGRADLLSAGTLVTAPGGHGAEYGLPIPTLRPELAADSVQAFVDARIAEGSDWIKLVLEDGHELGLRIPSLDSAAAHAVVTAAHRRGKLAVAHVTTLADARRAVGGGADGLAHLFVDSAPAPGFGRWVRGRGAFVIPTLSVLRGVAQDTAPSPGSGRAVLADPRLAPYLDAGARQALAARFPRRPGAPALRYDVAVAALRQLHAAGVPVLAGTDAGNPGTAHGASLHGELALLVEAGLTPAEALAAATSVPAARFRLADRGRVAPGLRADLVLVDGDPTRDIAATRAIVAVWKGGVPLDRDSVRLLRERERVAAAVPAPRPVRPADGRVSAFEGGTPAATYGSAFVASTDQMAGGRSTVSLAMAPGGANGAPYALALTGVVDGGLPYAWAGAMWTPGATPMAPVDLSGTEAVRFWARGDGGTYRLLVFTQGGGRMPAERPFVAGADWGEVVIRWQDLGVRPRDVTGLVLTGGPAPGPFSFRLDAVRIR